MPNVFILDDDEGRHRTLKKYAIEHFDDGEDIEIYVATNVEEAKKVLRGRDNWDLLLLDHDLGGRVYVDSKEENTGYQVTKFIVGNNIKFEICVLHSMNPVGVQNQINELKGLGYVYKMPFFLML